MKNLKYLFAITLSLVLFSFAKPAEDESIYVIEDLRFSIERFGSKALLKIEAQNLEQYDEIFIKRSENPTEEFRQVRYLDKNDISELASSGEIVDRFPLPGNKDAYYKIVAISSSGVYKIFPCVKLSKYE